MPVIPRNKLLACVACGDSGKNSKGGICYPCLESGRLKQKALQNPLKSSPLGKVSIIPLKPKSILNT